MILRFLPKGSVVVLVLVLISEAQLCPVPNIRGKKGNEKEVVDVTAGKDVRLPCQVKENGVITSWLKNNKTFSLSDHPRMRLKLNKYLKIKRVQKDDAAFYTCVAENDCGRNTYTMQLFVGNPMKNPHRNSTSAAPKFTVSPDKLSRSLLALPVGNSVKLDCSAEGHPRPTVTWYKEGARFLKRKGGSRLYLDQWTLLLHMKDLVPTDTGKYTCNVSNAYGWINHTYYVDVHERARAEPVVVPMENVTVHEGENATLLCKALSDTWPHFQWLRWKSSSSNGTTNGTIEHPYYEVIKQNLQDPDEHLVLPKSNNKFDFYGVRLTLVNVTKKDEGKYTCIVGNAVGYAVEQAYIIVHRKPNTEDPWHRSKSKPILTGKLNGSIKSRSALPGPKLPKIKEDYGKHVEIIKFGCSLRSLNDKQEQNVSQKHENSTDGMPTVRVHKDEMPGKKSAWTSRIKHPKFLIGLLAGVIVLAIITAGVCYWQVKKARATSSSARSRRPEIDSLRAKYEVQNEYVVVPDYNRNV